MTSIFSAHVDAFMLLNELRKHPIVVMPVFSSAVLQIMEDEAAKYPREPVPRYYGPRKVEQNYTRVSAFPASSILWRLGEKMSDLIDEASQAFATPAFTTPLNFTEIIAQFYAPHGVGIALHRDQRDLFKNLIAVCLIKGKGEFFTAEALDAPAQGISAKPGDVIFMATDGCLHYEHSPWHGVRNITEDRLTITYRQELLKAA